MIYFCAFVNYIYFITLLPVVRLFTSLFIHPCLFIAINVNFYGLPVIDLRFNIQYYTSSLFTLYLAQNQLLVTFYLLDLAQDCPLRLHSAPLCGDNPYFTAFIALKPSEHVYFIEAIYRDCYGDL